MHNSLVVNGVKLAINQMYIQSAINDILPEINSYTIGVLVHFKELFKKPSRHQFLYLRTSAHRIGFNAERHFPHSHLRGLDTLFHVCSL